MYHHIQSNGDLTGLKWGGQVDRNVEDFIPGRKLWKIESSRSSLGVMRTDETVERQQDGKIRQRENKSAKLKSIEDEVGEVEPETQANSRAAQGSNNSSCPNSSRKVLIRVYGHVSVYVRLDKISVPHVDGTERNAAELVSAAYGLIRIRNPYTYGSFRHVFQPAPVRTSYVPYAEKKANEIEIKLEAMEQDRALVFPRFASVPSWINSESGLQ
ncbi:hypothetical protein B0H14DRAFT_2560529 [Mycena olivaceomarginata]|nr:hypothetical protein B0H14DRAFT_2560529 [Mycena olivaceomarginata]